MFPRYSEIQIPLLSEIQKRGGRARPSDLDNQGRTVYEALADYFNLTPEAKTEIISSSDPRIKWENMVRWSRNDLRKKKLIDASERGVWAITYEAEQLLKEVAAEKVGRGQLSSGYKID